MMYADIADCAPSVKAGGTDLGSDLTRPPNRAETQLTPSARSVLTTSPWLLFFRGGPLSLKRANLLTRPPSARRNAP